MRSVLEFDPTVIRPALQQVRLAKITGVAEQNALPPEVSLKLTRSVSVELQELIDGHPVRVSVIISFEAKSYDADEDSPQMKLEAVYHGQFVYGEGVKFEDVTELVEQHGYQRELVLQAYPVALAQLRDLVTNMGVVAATLPLTPP